MMISDSTETRRRFLRLSAAAGTAVMMAGCADKPQEKGGEVTAAEDLMREHGVIRRALLIYTEMGVRLRSDSAAVPPDALQKTARLFRAFGEDYHEKRLEEAYIFPAVKAAGGPAANLADTLIAQHLRGREITDYILAVTQGAKLGAVGAGQLAAAFDSLARMYRAHAAREDTVIFPAWKQTLTAGQLDEMNDKFEEIEHQQFGKDGFEDAVRQISDIEASLGLGDLAAFTAPMPPQS